MDRIIDCHVHLNNYQFEKKQLSVEERLQLLLIQMEKNKIDHSIILSSYLIDDNRPSTSTIIDIAGKYNNIDIIAGYVVNNPKQENLNEYRKWLKDGIIKGIKLYCGYEHYYPYDKKYQVIYDLCTEFDVPVMIHSGDTLSPRGKIRFSHPINIDDVATDNPDLKVVICHMGTPWLLDCQEVVYKNKNVYTDVSGLVLGIFNQELMEYYEDKILDFIKYIGHPCRMLFGTDWPICDIESYINFFNNLKINSDCRELLMFKNAKKIFKI